jgi:hypothetical protein
MPTPDITAPMNLNEIACSPLNAETLQRFGACVLISLLPSPG